MQIPSGPTSLPLSLGRTAFQVKMAELGNNANLFQRAGIWSGMQQAGDAALYDNFNQLRRATPMSEDRLPGGYLKGSQEATDIINRSQTPLLSTSQEIMKVLLIANEIMNQQKTEQKGTTDELKKLGGLLQGESL